MVLDYLIRNKFLYSGKACLKKLLLLVSFNYMMLICVGRFLVLFKIGKIIRILLGRLLLGIEKWISSPAWINWRNNQLVLIKNLKIEKSDKKLIFGYQSMNCIIIFDKMMNALTYLYPQFKINYIKYINSFIIK